MEIIPADDLWPKLYVIEWYGFSPAMDKLVCQHGYAGSIDWWKAEVEPWMRELKHHWHWRGFNQDPQWDKWPKAKGYAFASKDDALLFKLIWHVDQHNPKMPLICSGKRSDP